MTIPGREWGRALHGPPGPKTNAQRSPFERIIEMLSHLLADLRYALRSLLNQPVHTSVIVATLVLALFAAVQVLLGVMEAMT